MNIFGMPLLISLGCFFILATSADKGVKLIGTIINGSAETENLFAQNVTVLVPPPAKNMRKRDAPNEWENVPLGNCGNCSTTCQKLVGYKKPVICLPAGYDLNSVEQWPSAAKMDWFSLVIIASIGVIFIWLTTISALIVMKVKPQPTKTSRITLHSDFSAIPLS
ncbi:hypothetical protein GPALN_007720 [Globodera pallida]|nr:hypothetical protein GPALN_007720 [Globodera pallida]